MNSLRDVQTMSWTHHKSRCASNTRKSSHFLVKHSRQQSMNNNNNNNMKRHIDNNHAAYPVDILCESYKICRHTMALNQVNHRHQYHLKTMSHNNYQFFNSTTARHRPDKKCFYFINIYSILTIVFIIMLHLTSITSQQQQHQQQSSTNDNISETYNNKTSVQTSTTFPQIVNKQAGDNYTRQTASSSSSSNDHQPAIEQVAKAEALTATAGSLNQLSPPPPQPIAAALQQSLASAKLFEVCKMQLRMSQQLTNLSQIMFQPSDICSSWHKMLRTNSDSSNSETNPWFYIEQLNLSHNNLTVLHDSSGMSRLVNLLDLKITHNQLSRCEESSLFGLQKLQNLDLSHNRLMALPSKFFQPVKGTLKKLNLSFNSISVLVPTLFESLNQLEYLDLSHNDITSHWINDRLFKNLTQLHYLDLSFNKLTMFNSPMIFSSLQQLETLSLQHNELRQVPDTIQHLRYLSSLDVSQNLIHDITNASYLSNCRLLFNLNLESNLLENITRDAFSDLPALKVLNLANNRIQHLEPQAFDYVPDLHALRLDSNRLVDFGQAFVNLRFLLMLNISSNRISSFDYAQIPLGLQWLDLHSNRIDKLNNFYYSPSAQQQYPPLNDIMSQQTSIGQQWQSMLRLTTLDASYNMIRELDNTSLPESLENVQLNNNHIKTIASHTFSTKSNLTRINLSHNQLTTLPFDALKLHGSRDGFGSSQQQQQQQQQKFVDVYLANNPFVCNCNTGWLSQLLLASSNLVQAHSSGGGGGAGTMIQASALPRDHTFTNTYALVLSRQLPRVADAHMISCNLPFGRQTPFTADPHQWSPVLAANQLALHHNHHSPLHITTRDQPIILKQSELLASVHLCPYKSHCFALCYCCDFDACDCEMSCPENCSCYYDQTWSTNIVDCSANNQVNGNSQVRFTQMMMGVGVSATSSHYNHYNNQRQPSSSFHHNNNNNAAVLSSTINPQLVKFTVIPEKIPMDVTELYLDGLELLHLRTNALIGRRNLKSLYLNNSQLYSIEPKALATQKALRVLQLNSNFLTELHGYEFEQQGELRELYLAHNRLTTIANNTFLPLKSLQILHLQGNQLYHFNFWSNIPTGHRVVSLNLGFNPWSCQCDYIEPMLQWLQMNIKHIHDRKSVTCQYNSTSTLHLISPLATPDDHQMQSTMYGSTSENYPMFEKRMCLNHTVYPVLNLIPSTSSPLPNVDADQQAVFSSSSSNIPPQPLNPPEPSFRPKDSSSSASTISFDTDPLLANGILQQPSNDEPQRWPNNNEPNLIQSNMNDQSAYSSQTHGIQYPPNSLSRTTATTLLTPSFLLVLTVLALVLVIVALSLVHYRRSMRMWFYSNYGLNMFSATKSHKHSGANSLAGKNHQHHQPHLSHQYGGVGSSAGSTSSSSAASSNLSQALCQQQASNNSSGLVTTPLIVTNNNNTITHNGNNHRFINSPATPYQDDEKLFDAYLTYSRHDEQFINDYIAPELECGQPPYRVALHYRDLPVTTNEFLTDCIIETANASRRVIMVVSEQLLRTEWMQYEFRAAHLEALRSNTRQRLIIILLGQPTNSLAANLDADMAQWLKMCTCVQWGEKMFWQRLRFAMPELAFNRQVGGGGGQYLRYQTLTPHQGSGSSGKKTLGLLKSTGLFGGGGNNNNNNLVSAQQQHQLIASNHSMHQSLSRPLPQQPNSQQQQHLYEEHHYAHLTPATMIQQHHHQQQQQSRPPTSTGHAYHQPIYGDPQQQQQQQQQHQQQRDPVHI